MSQATAIARANSLFLRFKARELKRAPISLHPLKEKRSIPEYHNPFLSTPKSDGKGHHSSRYSLRRQKELLKAANLLVNTRQDVNALNFLPIGPKSLPRITGGGVEKALAALGKEGKTISMSGTTTSHRATTDIPASEQEVVWKGSPPPRKDIGMYESRRVAFKRHRWERERKERRETIRKQIQGMDKRIAEWRNRRADKTAGTKLPF
ncbi:hypothetical protein CPB86DRAFT_772963 [Serendipita vermifera]|nr:hypothetical protein CPB86DRAFT_772963 [Serendipita vermifera]